jgi:RNA polymerase sigma-70 factor (ECF subfamily)
MDRTERQSTTDDGVQSIDDASSEAFEIFYRRQFRAVAGLALALSGDSHIAEELAQDAFVDAHRHWDRIAHYDDPAAWVRRVVANRAVSHWRRALAEARALARLRRQPVAAPGELSPEHDRTWALVRSLPRRQAQVIALVYLEDRTIADVASILGVAEPTAKTHLRRARETLARLLANTEGAP